ncbi:MAG: glycoside hydrolase family 2 TIM barrel-domain containing protein [Ruthenibacterium sp.]
MSALRTEYVPQSPPLQEYPRPQLQRAAWQNLNGAWEYAITNSDALPHVWQGEITVPFAIESALSGVQKSILPGQNLWYRRTFSVQNFDAQKRTVLQFGAVDYACKIYINGKKAGAHFGGYTPFGINISAYVKAEDNELLVCVTDRTDRGHRARGKQSLTPKGIWYTAVTGIWQTVWLEQISENHIHALRITPNLTGVTFEPICAGAGNIILEIFEGDDIVYAATLLANNEESIAFESPKLWTPETPFLYRVIATMTHSGRMTDRVESYFGLRTFGLQKDDNGILRMCLNGKPYFQKGLLDQGYWPDGLYTAPTDKALCSDISFAKKLGFNLLRKHVKVEPARWYYHCDRIGMLVWQDMPSTTYPGDFLAAVLPNLGAVHADDHDYARFHCESESARNAFVAELRSMMDALYFVTSLCVWVPFNEGWGQFDAARVAGLVRSIDTTRLVDHASGWHDQGAGDLHSIHKYILPLPALPPEENRAFVISEYGGYSFAYTSHLWDDKKGFGYRMYHSKAALTKAYVQLHEKQVLPLLQKGLCAVVYTQLTDVEGEVNGLLTYDRKICKIDIDAVQAINRRLML